MKNLDKNEIECIKSNETKIISNENNTSPLKKFLSELTGSIFLLFIGSGVGVYTQGDIVPISFCNGFILASNIYIFGDISGGHFNPSISLAMFLRKKLSLIELIYYIFGQLIGGFIGSVLVALCNRGKFDKLASNQIGGFIKKYNEQNNNLKIDAWSYISALLCDIFLTIILIIIYFTMTKNKNSINPLFVGFTLTMFIFAGFYISGGSMNIVRSLPPAVYEAFAGDNTAIKQIWIYIVGPFVGAIIGNYVSLYFI